MIRRHHPCNRCMLLLFVLGTLLMAEAQAAWWTTVLDAASDASKAAAMKSVSTTQKLRSLLKAHPPGSRPLRALRMVDGNVVSLDAAGKEVLIATAGVSGALVLTAEGSALLRAVDLVVPERDLGALGKLLKQAVDDTPDRSIRFARSDGSLGRVQVEQANGERVLMAEKYSGVFLQVAAEHTDELAWALTQPMHAGKIRVLSLFHQSDADVLRKIDDAIGEIHRPAGHVSADTLARTIKDQKRMTVFVVGHVEGDRFVVRDAAGHLQGQVPMAQLEAAAREADASIFMLGCAAAVCSRSSGYIDAVNALHVAEGLGAAIRQRSFGEALSALAGSSGRMTVQPTLIDSIRTAMIAERKADAVRAHGFQAVRLGTIASGRSRALASANPAISWIPVWLQASYVAGLILLAFSLPAVLRTWTSMRIPPPRFAHKPMVHVLVKVIRTAGILLLMPFSVLLYYFLVLAPWPSLVLVTANFNGAASIVSAGFGWWLWWLHREEITDQALLRRFWIIPVFSVAVTVAVSYCVRLIPGFDIFSSGLDQYVKVDWSLRAFYCGVSVLLAACLSAALITLLRKWRWNLNALLDWVIAAPLFLIEIVACRLIVSTRTSRDQTTSTQYPGHR